MGGRGRGRRARVKRNGRVMIELAKNNFNIHMICQQPMVY